MFPIVFLVVIEVTLGESVWAQRFVPADLLSFKPSLLKILCFIENLFSILCDELEHMSLRSLVA